uniref:succinate dehydrogenase cytochrome B560 subunit n=1 Tax=Kappaphycus malesianus TaxID=1408293 RepID=UPI00223781AB|nr:succinate dehydrogenase cytochrome B560 subunit [Kappaphycus malesianus]UYR20479.1 succinate dehydrogenase cytochrome B560 subunit [Kappaphycus malesianus]
MKAYTNNRPISPHLLIYKPQNSSLGSIWHRMTGILLLILMSLFMVNLKLTLNFNLFTKIIYDSYYYFWSFFYLLLVFAFSYHSFNGLRHILWDLGLLFHVRNLIYSFSLIIFFSSIILILNSLNL